MTAHLKAVPSLPGMETPPPAAERNAATERALLGAILFDNAVFRRTRADQFELGAHRRIFGAIAKLIEEGERATAQTVAAFFVQRGALAEIGGEPYLRRIAASALHVLDIATLASAPELERPTLTEPPPRQLPKPLVPQEVDLSDFEWMPLDVRRLRDSKISAARTGDEFRAAVLLWCAAWHQKPAGCLPNDDIELSQFAGFGRVVSEWLKVKAGALHGWTECSDGRLYHAVVCEKAADSWNGWLHTAWERECGRIRKENKRRKESGEPLLKLPPKPEPIRVTYPGAAPRRARRSGIPMEFHRASDGIPAENALKGEGEGEGDSSSLRSEEGSAASPPPRAKVREVQQGATAPALPELSALFDQFWKAYPSRGAASNPHKKAREMFIRLVRGGADPRAIIAGVQGYAEAMRKIGEHGTKFVCQATTS